MPVWTGIQTKEFGMGEAKMLSLVSDFTLQPGVNFTFDLKVLE